MFPLFKNHMGQFIMNSKYCGQFLSIFIMYIFIYILGVSQNDSTSAITIVLFNTFSFVFYK